MVRVTHSSRDGGGESEEEDQDPECDRLRTLPAGHFDHQADVEPSPSPLAWRSLKKRARKRAEFWSSRWLFRLFVRSPRDQRIHCVTTNPAGLPAIAPNVVQRTGSFRTQRFWFGVLGLEVGFYGLGFYGLGFGLRGRGSRVESS